MPLRTSVTDNPPRSDRRAQVSRTNGAKSRGPRSPDGKAKSAQNSKKHGLTGKLAPSGEEENAIEALIAKLSARYQADDHQQAALIDRVVTATLRLNRARTLITETLEDMAVPENPRHVANQQLVEKAIDDTNEHIRQLFGVKAPSRVLVKVVAEEAGYITQGGRQDRAALGKLIQYAQRFRGERDRALTRLEALRK